MQSSLLLATTLLVLGGCASANGGGARSITPGQPFEMTPGEQVQLPDASTLRYERVAADSRCPPDAQCIRAGDADVVFAFTPKDGSATTVQVNLPESPTATLGAWRLQLQALAFGDAPKATVQVDPAGG